MHATQTAPATDAFTSLELTTQVDFATWTELLRDQRRHKGLTRITVECFAGRAGFREIGELNLSDKDGAPIEAPGDVAELNADAIASAAFNVAKLDHKREARGRYRIQLWYVGKRKGVPSVKGDYATLLLAPDGSPVDSYGNDSGDPMVGVYRLLKEENKELRTFVKDMISSQVQMADGNAATMINAIELGKVTSAARMELAEHAARINTRATPEDWNRRAESISRNLAGPLDRVVTLLSQYMPPPGAGAVDAPGADGGQAAAKAFFDGLTADQKDALRDGLPDGCFAAIMEVLHGPTDQWFRERGQLKGILQSNQALLLRVLSPEQIAELQKVI